MSDSTPQHPLVSGESAETPRVDAPGESTPTPDPESDGTNEPLNESDQTIISKGPPLDLVPQWSHLRPKELGKALVGKSFDQFRLDEYIGGGGMGAVFRATDTMLGRTVAVKVLAGGHAADAEVQKRFRNEGQSAARLDHPNIAAVHYVGEFQGFHYIVFEYVKGNNLRELVSQAGPLPLTDALRITWQIAQALGHAWQRDVVHRDIKPSNVLATADGRVKLVDMGLARLHDVSTAQQDLTASGMTLGTFDYISPEQARDSRTADIRSDIYSLGCTLYFMLCGKPPFPVGSAVQKLLMHQSDAPPDVSDSRPDLPLQIDRLLTIMLAKAPEDRFQNPAELIAALSALADDLGITTTSGSALLTVQLPSRQLPRVASWLVWFVPIMLLLLVTMSVELISRNQGSAASLPVFASDANTSSRAIVDVSDGTSQSDDQSDAASAAGGTSSSDASTTNTSAAQDNQANSQSTIADDALATQIDDSQSTVSLGDFLLLLPGTITPDGVEQLVDKLRRMLPERSVQNVPIPNEVGDQQQGFFIVRSGTTVDHFDSLATACRQARDGDVIELRHAGPISIDAGELPIDIRGRKLVIRGKQGLRPTLVLRDSRPTWQHPTASPPMFRISQGELSLIRVDIDYDGSTTMAMNNTAAMFRVSSSAVVNVSESVLSMRSDQAGGGSSRQIVFHITDPDAPEYGGRASTSASELAKFTLQSVAISGGDVLLRDDSATALAFSCGNSFLALNRFWYESPVQPSSTAGDTPDRLEFDRITAVLGEGVAPRRYAMTGGQAEIAVHNSLIVVNSEKTLFPSRRTTSNWTIPQVTWQGEHNVYHGWPAPIAYDTSMRNAVPLQPALWRRLAGTSVSHDSDRQSFLAYVYWKQPIPRRMPFHELRPSNFALREHSGGIEQEAAKDGGPVGMRPDPAAERLAADTSSFVSATADGDLQRSGSED